MITKITGKLIHVAEQSSTLQIDAFEYQVRIPEFVRRQLQGQVGEVVSLHTIQYLEGNPAQGRLVPRFVGFSSEAEREFFEMFCSVDGVGVKKALRAMIRPVQDVADMIEQQDTKGLSALPGVGPATSERIVAKLRRKVSKFALMVSRDFPQEMDVDRDVVSEAFGVLRSLGHSESDARRLLDDALSSGKKPKTVEDMISAIYERSHTSL